jgi:anti-sigma-K factor RskA
MSDEQADNPLDDTLDDQLLDDQLLDVEQVLRSLTVDDLTVDDLTVAEAPPASVWAGIRTELMASGDLTSAASLAEHRARRTRPSRMLAAAAAVVVVAGAVVVVATRGGGDADVVASAQLTWDPETFDPLGSGATATAELVQGDDGYELVLTDAQLPTGAIDADLELWLISTDADGEITDVQPVSLVDPSAPGTYAVPTELDPDTYTVVDISIEPRDGDEAHSGNSILRGELQA